MSNGQHKCRALLLSAVFVCISGFGVHAQDFRNIASFSVENYFDGGFATQLENVFIAPVIENSLQLRLKVSNEVNNTSGEPRSLSMVNVGPIFLFAPNWYGIAAYGVGFRANGSVVQEAELQLNYETADFRVGGGARGQWEPSEDLAYVVPSIGGRVQLPHGFGLQATYFVSFNNDGEFNNSIWMEGDYALTPRLTFKLGGSAELGESVAWPDGAELTYNVITGAGYSFSDTVSARYQFDYIRRAGRPDGIRNFVYVDWRF